MDLQKLNVKLFVEPPNAVPLNDFIEIFHGWIQATDGVYHDVADYSHMHAGPGIVLVANDAHLSIDESDNRPGLLYSRKSLLGGCNQEKLRSVLRAGLENFSKLEREPKLGGKLKLRGNEVVIAINDRLAAPNTDESFAAVAAEIEAVAKDLFADAEISVEREPDRRRKFALRIKASRSFSADELLDRLKDD
ncbi:MAG TPA: hypothetical protein VIH18_33195 [Candidatus Binatia bacterium]|jgi:hypothetical protein